MKPTKCVIHLIDLTNVLNQDILFNSDIGNIITNFITNIHPELWIMMKRGDLLEDISCSGYISNGRYIIDTNTNSDFKSDLVVKELCTDYDDYGSILPNLFTITEFPIGYFDDIIINNYLCPFETMHSRWNSQYSYVCFDIEKLNLMNLTINDVYHESMIKKQMMDDKSITYKLDHLYIIIVYENTKYMIIQEFSHKHRAHIISEKINDLIKLFKEHRMLKRSALTDEMKMIASKQNVQVENVCSLL
jgi:hypothetical protein